jgi:hemolysin III
MVPTGLVTPKLRGRLHQVAFFLSIPAGIALVGFARAAAARVAAVVFAATLTGLYGVSAAYHVGQWSAGARRLMKHLDHSMIFVFIAGSYTPFARLDMPRTTGYVVLSIVWGGAVAGILLTMFWPSAPRWLGIALYLLLGWVAIWYTPLILHNAGVAATVLLAVGGALYSIGAVIYGLRRPDPWPRTFGYHELFHACTAVAAICQYIAMWYAVF